MRVAFTLNGQARAIEASPWARLLDVLRGPLGCTGTKEGCGEGECGACTVLLDNEPVNACMVAVGQCDGRHVTTVEGLADGSMLHCVQRALIEHGGTQCGICTPGIAVCAARAVQDLTPGDGTLRAKIRQALAGNICRCTGYHLIVDAVVDAVESAG